MKKKKKIMCVLLLIPVFLFIAFLTAYRFIGVGGKVIRIEADEKKGFYSEYYLYIPDTQKSSDYNFLLVEVNNTGFVDDNHKTHVKAAHNIIRFGQANGLARDLGIPLLIPCFDRPETDWKLYTHALDRDALLVNEGHLARIDRQLLAMIADARDVLADKSIHIEDRILLNGFSASGSFANRFTALYPEKIAAVAAGGVNSMVILPIENIDNHELIFPVGISDLADIADLSFDMQEFAAVPQYYYMGADDDNDALLYDDAYSDSERKLVKEVLDEDMSIRWENCRKVYESQGICAEFHTFPGVGHETTPEMNEDIASFFMQVMDAWR